MLLLCQTPTLKVLKKLDTNVYLKITDKDENTIRYKCKFESSFLAMDFEKKCISALNY